MAKSAIRDNMTRHAVISAERVCRQNGFQQREIKEGTSARRALRYCRYLAIRRRLHFVWRYRGPAPGESVSRMAL